MYADPNELVTRETAESKLAFIDGLTWASRGQYRREWQLLSTVVALHDRIDQLTRYIDGEGCTHGPDCNGTGPECAKVLTEAEAIQQGWDDALAVCNPPYLALLNHRAAIMAVAKRALDGWVPMDGYGNLEPRWARRPGGTEISEPMTTQEAAAFKFIRSNG